MVAPPVRSAPVQDHGPIDERFRRERRVRVGRRGGGREAPTARPSDAGGIAASPCGTPERVPSRDPSPARRDRPRGRPPRPTAPGPAPPTGTLRGRAPPPWRGGGPTRCRRPTPPPTATRSAGVAPEELQRDVPVRRGHPADVRERLAPRLDRRGDREDDGLRHVHGDEQPHRRLVGSSDPIVDHWLPLRCRCRGAGRPPGTAAPGRAPPARPTGGRGTRSPGTWNPRAWRTSSRVERDPHRSRFGAAVRLRARRTRQRQPDVGAEHAGEPPRPSRARTPRSPRPDRRSSPATRPGPRASRSAV